jgi:tripartite-type tricarboxylate transporter receptor subunit TctC
MVGGGLAIAKALFKSLPYNIETDFIPISTTASYGLVITTKAGSPYKTIKDVIANAKAHPGTLNFGTINAGSAQNLSAELFRAVAGLEVTTFRTKPRPIWRTPFCAATLILRSSILSGSSRLLPMDK